MKGNQPRGSFGIPPEMQENMERAKLTKEAQAQEEKKEVSEPVPQGAITDKAAEESEPKKIFKQLGIEFDDSDFNKLLFSGSIDKEIEIVKGKLRARLKSLTGAEYDEIDSIMSKEANDIPMSNEGFGVRKSMLITAYGLLELNGKPVSKPVKKDNDSIDRKATCLARREVLSQMAPAVSNIIMQKHGALTMALNQIAADPGDLLKNS